MVISFVCGFLCALYTNFSIKDFLDDKPISASFSLALVAMFVILGLF